ncbi:hypothetical protein BAE47_00270 [Acidithiobacillus thiooxidans]|uniref:hypothetical protein n=1 Tax=Acidithiobacillus thiooxidans TaxID=930 RepID=UPI000826F1D6|nr:hypothetical protein [Acidithiobacillus thiooxidans]OFC51220.1 hypothetical protein BAE47_00270 [Acidithiobacillus thiooxidans]
MEEKRSETEVAAPLSTGELSVYGLKPTLGQSSVGQLRAVYAGSIEPVLQVRQSAAAAISTGTALLLRPLTNNQRCPVGHNRKGD